jgi:hypothetical protein
LLRTYDTNIDKIMFFRDGSFMNIDTVMYFAQYSDSESGFAIMRKIHAPFWMPQDFLELLGGKDGKYYKQLK